MEKETGKNYMKQINKNIGVLFVEDELIITLNITTVLKRRFGHVYSAENGQEGLAQFKEHRPDIVITDILMPEMDGLEMISRIKEINPDTSFIIMTAANEESYLKKAKELGIHRYLIKPANDEDFLDMLYNIAANL